MPEGGVEWRAFNWWEIHPTMTGPAWDGAGGTWTESCDPHEADQWTLYGHYLPGIRRGGLEAIHDAKTPQEALDFARRLSILTGVPFDVRGLDLGGWPLVGA